VIPVLFFHRPGSPLLPPLEEHLRLSLLVYSMEELDGDPVL
jgi:hypothetical protein